MARRKKVIGTAVALGALGLGYGLVTWNAEKEYRETLRELRTLGAATSGSELNAMGQLLGESDGSFEKALAAYRATPGADEYAVNMRGWAAASGPGDAKRARQALVDVIPLVKRVAASSRLDTGVWRRDSDFSDSRLYAVKAFAGMMVGESKLASLRGDHEAALAALEAANGISVLTSQNPTQFETLLAVACQGLHWSAGRDYLNQFSDNERALESFQKYLESREQIQSMGHALKGELGFLLEGLNKPGAVSAAIEVSRAQSGLPPKPYETISEALMSIPSVRSAAKRKLAAHFRDALTVLRDEPEPHNQFEKLTKLDGRMDADRSLSGRVVNLLWDGFETPVDVSLRTLANGRILRVSASCLAQRAKSGKLPTNLPSIGQDSIDPYSGEPLLYSVRGDSFKVYSIGKNLSDDGGEGERLADIVFEFVPPAPKIDAARVR